MPKLTKPVALLVSTALAATMAVPAAEAQPRHLGAAIGIGAGIGILGLILSQQQARARARVPVQPRRIARPPQQPNQTAQKPDMAGVQRALVARGYDVGTPNGQAGPKTRAAIQAYQRDNNLPPTGKLTLGEMTALVAAAGTAAVGFTAASGLASSPLNATQVAPPQAQSPLLLAAERDLASGPVDLPISPDDPAWAAGTWSGTATCWRRTYTISLVLPLYSEGTTAKLQYKWQDSRLPARGSDTVDRGGGLLEMRRTRRGLEPVRIVSGEQDHPFGDIKLGEGKDRTPLFTSAPCRGELALQRDPLTVPKRALSQTADTAGAPPARDAMRGQSASGQAGMPVLTVAAAPSPRAGIMGLWDGELKCTNGRNRQVNLRFGTVAEIGQAGSQRVDQNLLSADRAGRIALQVTQIIADNSGGSSAWTRLVGEPVDDGQGYRFVSVSSSGYSDSPLRSLNLQFKDGAIEGTSPGETCSSLKAARPDPLAGPDMASVPVPAGGGSFYAARDIVGRCDALIKWGAPAEAEFGEARRKGQRIDTSILFADPQFIPVFGRPLEATRATSVGADIYNTIRECAKDPLTRPRLEFFLGTISNQVVQHTGFNDSALEFIQKQVAQTRAALNRLHTAKVEATRMTELSDAIIHLASARIRFESQPVAMGATAKAEISAGIIDTLSRSAERLIEQEERKIERQPAWTKLESLRELRSFSTPALMHLEEQAKTKVLARLKLPESASAASLFEPMMEQARQSPASVEGLKAMAVLEHAKLFAVLSPSVRQPLEAAWTKLLIEKQQEALGQELAKPMTSPRDAVGLQYGAGWFTSFKQRWQGYETADVMKTTLRHFFDDRRNRLREVLPTFQSAVSGVGPDQKAALRDRYLALEEDRRDPVSLEYDLAIAGI